jgi:hypothetical protein
MKKKFATLMAACFTALPGFSALAQVEKNDQPLRLGLRFEQLEHMRQSLNASYKVWGPNTYGGVLVGSQGFREIKDNDQAKIRAATDIAATLHNEVSLQDQLMMATGLELGWRLVPKRDDGKSKDHAYATLEERIGLKQGSVFLFLGVGYRVNFTNANNPPILGFQEIPMSGVYPRIGFDVAI